MRALIVGLGSIGRRHLENLRSLEPMAQVTVLRHSETQEQSNEIPGDEVRVVHSIDEALKLRPDIAILANPASMHMASGLALAQAGVSLLVEKPLAHTLEGVEELINVCQQRHLVLMVGYNLRFYQPLQVMWRVLQEGRIGRLVSLRAEVGQFLPDWRPGRDYRKTVSAKRELGGGALFELSHELDYVRWLAGEVNTVSACVGQLSDLEIDVEDTVELILQFRSGGLGSVHLNMVQHPMSRRCHLIGTEGTLTWDGVSHQVRWFSTATQRWSELHPTASLDRNEMYVAELRHFLECVRAHEVPAVDGEEGRRTLELILAAKRSAEERRAIDL